jgi:hypothetical protein
MTLQFKDEIKPYIYSHSDQDLQPCEKFTVKWQIDIEVREWGIKGFNISVLEIDGYYTDEVKEDPEQIHFHYDSESDWIIEDHIHIGKGAMLLIYQIEIDIESKTIEIS